LLGEAVDGVIVACTTLVKGDPALLVPTVVKENTWAGAEAMDREEDSPEAAVDMEAEAV
jgi:hypothetical protein